MPRDQGPESVLAHENTKRDEVLREVKTLLHGLLGDAVRIVPEYRDGGLVTLFVIPKEAHEHIASWAVGMTHYWVRGDLPQMWVRCTTHDGGSWLDASTWSAKLAALVVAEGIDGLPHLPADHPERQMVTQARALTELCDALSNTCEAFDELEDVSGYKQMNQNFEDVVEWAERGRETQGRQMRTYRITLPEPDDT